MYNFEWKVNAGDPFMFILFITVYSRLSTFIIFAGNNKNDLEIIEKKVSKKAEYKS